MDKVQQPMLYIIDDDIYRNSLARLLNSAGYSAQSFPSAKSFLDSVPVVCKAGVLILDLRMSDMDGFALQKKMNEAKEKIHLLGKLKPAERKNMEKIREGLRKQISEQVKVSNNLKKNNKLRKISNGRLEKIRKKISQLERMYKS